MRTQWVFLRACGCPFGVLEGSCAANEDDAWWEFFESARRAQAARASGVTVEHVSHDGYVKHFYPKMLSSYTCPHQPAGVA